MKEYSFLDTLLLINGVEMQGYDEGDDVIGLERLTDSTSHKIGTDGEMTISISADRSGKVTFRLMQTSDSNSFLSAIVSAAENGAFVPVSIMFKDTRGNDIGSAANGYIAKPAPMVRGKNANAQEWVVTVERLDLLFLGGA